MSDNTNNSMVTYSDLENPEIINKISDFVSFVNKPPRQAWIKKHPMSKTEYLPVDKVEFLMTVVFGGYRREIKEAKQIANSVMIVMRVHYFNRWTNQWEWQDGIGAAPLQTDSGSSPMDANAIKAGAVQIGAPAAASFAFKDACENIGRLFGRDLNRKDLIAEYRMMAEINQPQTTQPQQTTQEDITTQF